MKKERGRKTMQGTTITQGNTQRGSWLPTRIPYKYLSDGDCHMVITLGLRLSDWHILSEYHPKFGVRAYVEARQPLHLTVAISEM